MRPLQKYNALIAFFNWEAGITCTCGKCMQPTERNRQLNKARYDVLSIPGNVIKENPTHGARHSTSMRQCTYYKAHEMLKKAPKHKSGGYENTLDRWHIDDTAKPCQILGALRNRSFNQACLYTVTLGLSRSY